MKLGQQHRNSSSSHLCTATQTKNIMWVWMLELHKWSGTKHPNPTSESYGGIFFPELLSHSLSTFGEKLVHSLLYKHGFSQACWIIPGWFCNCHNWVHRSEFINASWFQPWFVVWVVETDHHIAISLYWNIWCTPVLIWFIQNQI